MKNGIHICMPVHKKLIFRELNLISTTLLLFYRFFLFSVAPQANRKYVPIILLLFLFLLSCRCHFFRDCCLLISTIRSQNCRSNEKSMKQSHMTSKRDTRHGKNCRARNKYFVNSLQRLKHDMLCFV